MTAALKKLGDDAAALETYRMPACADPHGYYAQMPAMDPAKKAETLSSKIDAEVKAAHISTAS